MKAEKMVRMANQIATFFASQPGDRPAQVAQHINDYWEPRMRRQLIDHVAAGGEGLAPLVLDAMAHIREPA